MLLHTYLTPWQQHSLGSQHVHPHSSLQILHPLTPILQMDKGSTRELKGFSQSTQELFGNQEIPVCPHPLWSQLCLNLCRCHFRNAVEKKMLSLCVVHQGRWDFFSNPNVFGFNKVKTLIKRAKIFSLSPEAAKSTTMLLLQSLSPLFLHDRRFLIKSR